MTASPTQPTGTEGTASDRMVHRLVGEWTSADLITDEQAAAIEAYHHDRHAGEERTRGFGRMVAVASTLGAVLVGAGILLIVASNWASYARSVQILIAMAAFVVLEGVGYLVRYRTDYHRTGEAILFIGAVAYGGAIFLVGQVYNRPLDDPNLFVYWLVPMLPLAYVVRSRLIAALAILVTYGVVAYRLEGWLQDAGTPERAVFTLYLMLGAAVFALGGVQRDVRSLAPMAAPWEWIGGATILVVTFAASFEWMFRGGRGPWISEVDGSMLTLIVVCGIVTAGCVVARTAIRQRFDAEVAFTATVAGLAVAASAILIPASYPATGWPYALMNLTLLALIVTLAVGGIALARESLVNIALVAFAITVFARYLEIGAGMLGTGTAMIIGGVLLLGLGVGLQRFRKALVDRMHVTEVTP